MGLVDAAKMSLSNTVPLATLSTQTPLLGVFVTVLASMRMWLPGMVAIALIQEGRLALPANPDGSHNFNMVIPVMLGHYLPPGLLGLALGWLGPWYLFIGFLVANILGSTVGIGLMLSRRATRKTALPYGVFLTAGAVVALLLGAPIIHWYSHLMSR